MQQSASFESAKHFPLLLAFVVAILSVVCRYYRCLRLCKALHLPCFKTTLTLEIACKFALPFEQLLCASSYLAKASKRSGWNYSPSSSTNLFCKIPFPAVRPHLARTIPRLPSNLRPSQHRTTQRTSENSFSPLLRVTPCTSMRFGVRSGPKNFSSARFALSVVSCPSQKGLACALVHGEIAEQDIKCLACSWSGTLIRACRMSLTAVAWWST